MVDHGAFLDASWRIYKGQKPYIDFIYTTGPIHLYMNAFFFFLLGFGKSAILTHLITVSSLVAAATFFIAQRRMPLILTLIATLLSVVGFYWWFPHPWYDHSAFLFGVMAVWLLIQIDAGHLGGRAFWITFWCGAMALLSFMTKTNIGACFLLVFGLYALSFRSGKLLLGYASGIFAALGLIFLLIPAPAALIENVFTTYGASASQRLLRFVVFETFLKSHYWVPFLVVLLNLFYLRKSGLRIVFLFFGIIATAIFTLNTGSLREASNISLYGVAMALAFMLLYQSKAYYRNVFEKTFYAVSITCLIGISVWQIVYVSTYSFGRAQGKFAFFPVASYSFTKGPFEGWLVGEDPDRALNPMIEFVKTEIPKEDSLLILTNLQIINALTGRDSYRGVPFLWDLRLEIVPAPGKQLESVWEQIVVKDPPVWILTEREPQFPPEKINELIAYLHLPPEFLSQYRVVKNWGRYGILKRLERSEGGVAT